MAPKLTAAVARQLAGINATQGRRSYIRKHIRAIENDILDAVRRGSTDVFLGPWGLPEDEILAPFLARGFHVTSTEGVHQGGGTCRYYRLSWGEKPAPRTSRGWWKRLFDEIHLPWNERM
jgi:hypothetical protein